MALPPVIHRRQRIRRFITLVILLSQSRWALRINMTAQVYIVENKVSNVLSVPAAAIKTDPKWAVMLKWLASRW